MKIALVYNPRLSRGRMARVQKLGRVLERRGHEVIHGYGDDFLLTRDAPDAHCLVLAGGDGTARLIIGNQPDKSALPPVAIYPTGTINLISREIGYPTDPVRFAERIEKLAPALVTRLATINGAPFLACASIGFDAYTVASVSETLKSRVGRLAYVAALLSLLHKWPRKRLTLDTGSERMEAEVLFILRGRFYAGPWTLDRGAGLDKEPLRILALPKGRRRDMARLLLYAVLGSRHPHPRWRFVQAERAHITCAGDVPIQADGDVIGTGPVEVSMSDDRLSFL